MTCSDCKYFVPDSDSNGVYGLCHRYPPTNVKYNLLKMRLAKMGVLYMARYPIVFADDISCGEFAHVKMKKKSFATLDTNKNGE